MIAGAISGVVDLGRDNDARLLRLRTALALGTGFQLVLIEVEPGPIRKEVVRRIQTWSGCASIGALTVVSLDPDATLAAQLDVPSGAIVTGLEPPSPAEAPVRDWIAELNWSRDALPELVPGPLVLVVSQATHRELFERASDLYSWRRHTARVVTTARDLALPLASPGDRYWLEQRELLTSILAEVVLSRAGRATLLLDLADVLLQLGDEPGASRVLDEVAVSVSPSLEDGDDEHVLARCKLGRAQCALVRRDLAAARAFLDEVASAADLEKLQGKLAPPRGKVFSAEGARDEAVAATWAVDLEVLQGSLELVRGKLTAADGAWDEAVMALTRTMASAELSAPLLPARARECLCQVALARGDIACARRELAKLVEVVAPYMDAWGTGMLLRLAEVAVGIYPDESAPLLDAAFSAAASSSRRETLLAIQCLRAKRAWLLARVELAREELARVKQWIHLEDPAEAHASLSLCEAGAALVAGSTSGDEVAAPLARACELFRPTAPGQAAAAGTLLAEFWRSQGRFELAVTAYQVAARDARTAGDLALAADAELGELGAAVEGGIEQADAPDRLRALADQLRIAEHVQSEGNACADLGRCLLRRGLRDLAIVELERARACFAATTDVAGERSVVRLLDAPA